MDIHYQRPHKGATTFRQQVLEATAEAVVTFQPRTRLEGPVLVESEPILEPDSPAIWFTFPGTWHDIGLFHLADGRLTGVYANVLTPVELVGPTEWRTTDLYLDVWIPTAAGGRPTVLDEDELSAARERGLVDEGVAERARQEAASLIDAAAAGTWPPPVVGQWNLPRARAAASTLGGDPESGAQG